MPEEDRTTRPRAALQFWAGRLLGVWLLVGLGWGGWEWWRGRVPASLPMDPVAWHAGDRGWNAPLWPMTSTLYTGAAVTPVEGNPAFRLPAGALMDWGRFAAGDDRMTLHFKAWLKPAAEPPEFFETYLASWMGADHRGILKLRRDGLAWELERFAEKGWERFHDFSIGRPPMGRWCSMTLRAGRNAWDFWVDGTNVSKAVNWYSPFPKGAMIRFMGNMGGDRVSLNGEETPDRTTAASIRSDQVMHNPQWGIEILLDDLILFDRKLSDAEVEVLGTQGRGVACRAYASRLDPRPAWWLWVYVGIGFLWLGFWTGEGFGRWVWMVMYVPEFRPVRWALLVGGCMTTLVVIALHREAVQGDAERFREMHGLFRQLLDTQFEKIAGEISRVADWARFQPRLDPVAWEEWVNSSSMMHDHTALLGVGYALQVPREQQVAHDREWTESWGFPYAVWPKEPPPRVAGSATRFEGDPRLPVVLYAAMDPVAARWKTNGSILGRDLLWVEPGGERAVPEPLRIEDAVGDPGMTSSGREQIAPASWFDVPVHGLRLYQPHRLKRGEALGVIRADEWRGVAFANVDLRRWMLKDFQELNLPLGCRIYTGISSGTRHDLLLDTSEILPASRRPERPRLETTLEIPHYGSRLWVDCWTTQAFERQSRARWPWGAGFGGGAFTILTAMALGFQVRARLRERAYADRLSEANAALAKAQRERARLSRDLHDGSIQSLYALGLHLRHARRQVAPSQVELGSGLAECQQLVQGSIVELRDFLLQLKEEAGPARTYREVVEEWVRRLRRISSEEIDLTVEPASDGLPSRVVLELVQITREAVSNAMRHGGAERIGVTLKQGPVGRMDWVLEVVDDGRGWAPGNEPKPGIGFRSMRERAKELGGEIEITSRVLGGTTVRVCFGSGDAGVGQMRREGDHGN